MENSTENCGLCIDIFLSKIPMIMQFYAKFMVQGAWAFGMCFLVCGF